MKTPNKQIGKMMREPSKFCSADKGQRAAVEGIFSEAA